MESEVWVWVDVRASDQALVHERVSLVGFLSPGLFLGCVGDEELGLAWRSPFLREAPSEVMFSGGCFDLTAPSGARDLGAGVGK